MKKIALTASLVLLVPVSIIVIKLASLTDADKTALSATATPPQTAISTATATPTPMPTVSLTPYVPITPTPSPTPDRANLDFAFLDGLSKEYFEDAEADQGGAWFPGNVRRNLETGEVTYIWDRYDSTLKMLDTYGAIYRKNADQKLVYLTFDIGYDGGEPLDGILDALAAKNAHAIFFMTSKFVKSEPDMVKRIAAEGHLIGNHTANHKNMAQLSNEEFVSELLTMENDVKAVLGDSTVLSYYRPPIGACTERDLALAKKLGYTTVFWSFHYLDYEEKQPVPKDALLNAKKKLHNGCVYLLHANSSTNAAIIGDLIDYMHQEGYSVRRIDE